MYSYANSSTVYVSQTLGDDDRYNGLAPSADAYGNGPYKTIVAALHAVGDMRVSGINRPLTIALCDDYYTDVPVRVSLSRDPDSAPYYLGGNGITFTSYGKRRKLVGGIRIDGWKKDSFNGYDCLSAVMPQRKDGKPWAFTELFVNGLRCDRPRYPETGDFSALDTEKNVDVFMASSKWFIADKKDLAGVPGIEDAIISYYHYWIDAHTPVESYDPESGKLVMKYGSRFNITAKYEPEDRTKEMPSAFHYFFENIPVGFKKPGQWYLDRKAGIVYYIPHDESITPETMEAYAPTAEKLMEIEGAPEKPITDIRLRDLEILYTSSDYVSRVRTKGDEEAEKCSEQEEYGYASDIQSVCWAYGAIVFKYAERCGVEDCCLHGLGVHAVEVSKGCQNIRIERNEMFDLGAGGVKVLGAACDEPECDRTHNVIVRGNSIRYVGRRFAAACGVLVMHAYDNEITDNEIAYLDYTGISVGWVWGYEPSITHGNRISRNHIHHVGMGRLSDMGGIYLLGRQQGTIVSENRIHDVTSYLYGGWGIYTDEGSSYNLIERNVVYNTKCQSFHQHYGTQNVVRNNIFAFGGGLARLSRPDQHEGALFEHNIFLSADGEVYGINIEGFACRNNLYYFPNSNRERFFRGDKDRTISFEDWQNVLGQDRGSVIADPLFADAAHYDFTLSENSPALSLGFEPLTGFLADGKKH